MNTATPTPTQAKTEKPDIEFLSVRETRFLPRIKFDALRVKARVAEDNIGNATYRATGEITLHVGNEDLKPSNAWRLDIDCLEAEVQVTTDTGAHTWIPVHDDCVATDPDLDEAILEALLAAAPRFWLEDQIEMYERGIVSW